MNTEHKPELPAEVREAIINTVYQPGFWHRREPVTELCAALAPLWPKRPAPTSDAQQVAKRICDLAEIVRRDGGEWIALDVEKVAAVLAPVLRERDDLRAQLAAWQDRFRALVGDDFPDGAGNAVITLRAQLAAAQEDIARLTSRNADLARLVANSQEDSKRLDWLLSPDKHASDAMSIAVFHNNRGAGWITTRAAIDKAMKK